MKDIHSIVHYILILWVANDFRDTLSRLDNVFTLSGIFCILALVALCGYFLYFVFISMHRTDE